MKWRVCLSDLDYGVEETGLVEAVLRSKWLSMGEQTLRFEQELAEYLGVKHAFLVANCTAALHLANLACGIGPGDEVLMPALTFVATANASRYCGALPVFADVVGPHDLNLCPDDVRARLTPATRAITVVHYGGYPADMDALLALARERDLRVIEDAAHAPGASLRGSRLGTLGDVGCLSFFANKNLATGEGGAVVTQRDDYAERIRAMRSHGMTSLSFDRHKGHAFSYDVTCLGYNYRATEITAALGRAQLAKLDRNNARRVELVRRYQERLRDVAGLQIPFVDYRGQSACHLMAVLLPGGCDRSRVMQALREDGIQTSIHYPPVHRFSAYANMPGLVRPPRTEALADRILTLPLHPLMSDGDVAYVCERLCASIDGWQ